jgi:hypothetical protein
MLGKEEKIALLLLIGITVVTMVSYSVLESVGKAPLPRGMKRLHTKAHWSPCRGTLKRLTYWKTAATSSLQSPGRGFLFRRLSLRGIHSGRVIPSPCMEQSRPTVGIRRSLSEAPGIYFSHGRLIEEPYQRAFFRTGPLPVFIMEPAFNEKCAKTALLKQT